MFVELSSHYNIGMLKLHVHTHRVRITRELLVGRAPMPLSRGLPQVIPEPTDGGRVCLSDHGEQAGGSLTWALPTLSVCRCVSLHVSHACCLTLLPGSHCRARLYEYVQDCCYACTHIHVMEGKRDAGCCDAIATKPPSPHRLTRAAFTFFFYSFYFNHFILFLILFS